MSPELIVGGNGHYTAGRKRSFVEYPPGRVLTLFTTVRDVELRRNIQNNTLHNWASLRPAVLPVLFTAPNDTREWQEMSSGLGWIVESAPRTRSGVPILKDMFKFVSRKHPSPFLGFANADNLFGTSLIHTLSELNSLSPIHKRVSLITGRRRNVPENLLEGYTPQYVEILASNLSLYSKRAQDYFITSHRAGFCWGGVPDFVVGRIGYDNWLMVRAQQWNVTLVDASDTITVLHQVGKDGVMSGFRENRGSSRNINYRLAPGFDFRGSGTECAPWKTLLVNRNRISGHAECTSPVAVHCRKIELSRIRNPCRRVPHRCKKIF